MQVVVLVQIRFEGMDSVIDALRRKETEIKENASRGMAKGCKIVEGEAKARCPVSTEATRPGGPHGELRESITSQSEGLTGIVGTNKEYAGYVELGTCKMPAQPYLVPALIAKKDEVIQAIADEVKG